MSADAPTEYLTIAQSARVKLPMGACRFCGSVDEVQTEEEAAMFLDIVRSEHPDLKNHAWAFRIGTGRKQLARVFDGGEPTNSAGPPILRAIDHLELTNTMVVVSRYFGEKHGVGGLIRCFHRTAATVLEEAGIRQELVYITIGTSCRYDQHGYLLHELEKVGAKNLKQDYQELVCLSAQIRPHEFEGLAYRVNEWTKGAVRIERIEDEEETTQGSMGRTP